MTESARDVIAGNVYDKYHTKNPIARRLFRGFESVVMRFYMSSETGTVLEVGCGEGHLLERLRKAREPQRTVGIDLSWNIVAQAASVYGAGAYFHSASAYALPFADDSFDLVVACEVLEHLEEPRRAVDEIARVAARGAIFTVPREPLWRALNLARGRYWRDLGNTPGHVQHYDRRTFETLISARFSIAEVATPTPWIAIRAVLP